MLNHFQDGVQRFILEDEWIVGAQIVASVALVSGDNNVGSATRGRESLKEWLKAIDTPRFAQCVMHIAFAQFRYPGCVCGRSVDETKINRVLQFVDVTGVGDFAEVADPAAIIRPFNPAQSRIGMMRY